MRPINHVNIVLIKPSKYDDEGFVIRYFRGVLPSNTLACMNSLTLKFADNWLAEKNIHVSVEIFDDIVDDIPYRKIARMNSGNRMVIVALVGVQSNQFVRASDIAKKLNALNVITIIGGFHISGVLALFDAPSPEIQELIDLGIIVVAGEAEQIWESILSDIVENRAKTLYRASSYPDISNEIIPYMDKKYLKKFALPSMATIDCSRGCPFNCSFCTIINVQGHTVRCRSAQTILDSIQRNFKVGIDEYFFTDDNFSRNPAWRGIFDGLIHLRESEDIKIAFMMQVDTASARIPHFVEKAAQAGCSQVFIGMESINPRNLEAVGKKHNKVEHYAAFIKAWNDAGVATHVGYIIGFPFDTLESVRENINRLKNEIKVDQASFFILTPLPGSKDHYDMVMNGIHMEADLNKFDSFHVTTDHPLMSKEDVYKAYEEAWESFYDIEHLKNILMKSIGTKYWNIFRNIMWYKNSLLEPRHPMVAGFIRKKHRTDIRSGTKRMGVFKFHLMRFRELAGGLRKRIGFFFEIQELWWLTRKPDDPKFKFVADFTAALSEAKTKLSSIDFTQSCDKWRNEATGVITSLKKRIGEFNTMPAVKESTKRRFNEVLDDLNVHLEKVHISDQYTRGIVWLTSYLNSRSRLVEEFMLKNVARRRKITSFWFLTWDRIRHGNIIRFTLSIPKIIVSMFRDFFMSLRFILNLFNRTIRH